MKLNKKRTFFIGLAFLSICSFWQMYDNVVPLILKETFGMNETVTGAIMAADNVLALFLLPLIGAFSDRVNTRLGKRTPFIIVGTVLAIIAMMTLPYADQQGLLPMFVIGLGVTLFAMGLYRSPAVALMPDLTPKPLRSKGNAVINFMGAIGGVYTLIMIQLLVPKGDHPNYYPLFISIAAIMIVSVILLMITTNEKKTAAAVAAEYPEEAEKEKLIEDEEMPKEVRRSLLFLLSSIFLWFFAYNAITSAFSRYATEVWGAEGGEYASYLMIATIAAILAYLPIGIISTKIGRKKTILIGLVMMIISFIIGAFFVEFHWSILIAFGLIGIGWSAVNVNSLPMVVEMSKGSDIGRYTGFYYTFSMAAQILTPIVSGALLQYVSYRTLFPYAAVFTALAFCTMQFVKHGDSKPEPKKSKLEHFDFED
jgi:MFS family permease